MLKLLMMCGLLSFAMPALAQTTPAAPAPMAKEVKFDAELAKSLGADERGMRSYVLVILKTGPNKVPAGPERTKMFSGHFANMQKLSDEKKLVMAGPLDGVDGWRGLFVFNTADIDTAKTYVATDPVIISGEMIAEYHKFYSSAAMMAITDIHNRISKK